MEWKENNIEFSSTSEATVDAKVSPIVGETDGGLDAISSNASDLVEKPKPIRENPILKAIVIEGDKTIADNFCKVIASHYNGQGTFAVPTECGLPLGAVMELVNNAQKKFPNFDVTKDKIYMIPKIKKNCKRCYGRGHLGFLMTDKGKSTGVYCKCNCFRYEIQMKLAERDSDDSSHAEQSETQ